MPVLTDGDFRPLADFELLWRLTNSKEDVIPEPALAHFQPLTHARAAELWNSIWRYGNELWSYAFKGIPDGLPETSRFVSITRIDANSQGIERTTDTLMSLGLPHNELVIVMWDVDIALRVPWGTFCTYWSDLCLPCSDDVSICPISEVWFLQYHHEDQFVFGKRRVSTPSIEETSMVPEAVLLHQDEVLRLLQANEKIAAIKLYQKETKVSFKEAIAAVEKLACDIHT